MAESENLLFDLLILVYSLAWLMFLTHEHWGQVTTTAGHIFELNVLFNNTLYILVLILILDLDFLPKGTMYNFLDTTIHTSMIYSFLVAMAGSQIETAIFLKTLNVNVNTMRLANS